MRHFWTIEVRLVVDTNVRMAAELAFPKGRSPAAQLLQLLHKKNSTTNLQEDNSELLSFFSVQRGCKTNCGMC
jgi:tRNA A37 methylthiotransferase MiaB